MKFNLTIRQITVVGLLSAVSLLLGSTPLGIIPVPTPAGAATIMHIPAIIGGSYRRANGRRLYRACLWYI